MATIALNYYCDLNQAVKVQYIDGNVFSGDNAGNTISVFVMDGDQPATIGGSVSADVIRADGSTVAVSGALDENRAYVILPQACYAVPGPISIVIKNTQNTTITTIAALVGNVYRSSTDEIVDPGTIIPSIQSLISSIETAVASIPADYSSLWTSLAPAFNSSAKYVAGQYVTFNGGLYRFTTAHSGEWSSSDVVATNLGGDISDLKSAINTFSTTINGTNGLATNVFCQINKQRTYILTNNTPSSVNLNVIKQDGTYQLIESGITSGASYTYTADAEYKGVRIYFAADGACTLISADDGLYSKIYNTDEDFAAYSDSLFADNVLKPFVILRENNLTQFSIPLRATFEISTVDGEVFDTNSLIAYGSDGTTQINSWGLSPYSGNKRVITNNSGDIAYVKLNTKSYRGIKVLLQTHIIETAYLEEKINNISASIIDEKLLNPFTYLRSTDLVAFAIPNKTTVTIETIDGKAFDTNGLKMYASDGTTLLNTWNVVPATGTKRTITNNSGNGAFVSLVNASSRPIKITALTKKRQPKEIRVMQYNIGKFNYGHSGGLASDVETKIVNYKKFFGEYKPNICGLEEYTDYIDSASTYASNATLFDNLYFFSGEDTDVDMAVKSDYDKKSFTNFYTKNNDNTDTGGVFVEYYADVEGVELVVVAGAIAAGKPATTRAEAFENLLKRYLSATNVLILIDTNVISETEHDNLITTANNYNYSVANGGYFGKFDTYNLQSEYYHKIDNVLVKGDIKIKNVIVPDVYADLSSDHYPFIADIEMLL